MNSLIEALVKDRDRRTIALTSVQGMGGIGKTVLVQGLCEDARVKAGFPDGIIWQSMGKESAYKVGDRLRAVCLALDEDCKFTRSEMDHYKLLMRDKSALLIVDDVWSVGDIEPFLATAPRSRVLFTTRNQEIAASVGAQEHHVELLSEEQARLVFARWAGREVEELSATADEIIGECRGLALALGMVGAMLRGKPAAAWERTLKSLKSADLEKIGREFPGYPYPSLFAAMEVSVDALKVVERDRYYALAVLLEEMSVSVPIQQALWGTSEEDSADTAETLIGMSLAQRDAESTSIRLHDLQLDYIRRQYPDCAALGLIHSAMRLSSHVIAKDAKQFTSQVVGRLLAFENEAAVAKLLFNLKKRSPRPCLLTLLPVLDSPGGALIRTLAGHTNWVNGVALSGDGKVAVSVSSDTTVKVWEVESGREVCLLAGHTNWVNGVALSTDGRIAISASADKTLRVWDVESGRELRTLEGHRSGVNGVALSGNGRFVVSASSDKTLKMWEVASGRELRTLRGHTDVVNGVAVSADGRVVVSASSDKTVKVWEVDSGHVLRSLEGHSDRVNGVALSRDGKLAISASWDHLLKVWDVESGRELRTLKGHIDWVRGVAMSADGRLVLSASDDHTLKIWQAESGHELRTLPGHTNAVTGVVLSGDEKLAISASSDHTLKVWKIEFARELPTLQGHTNSVTDVVLSGDGKLAVSASWDHTLKVWAVDSGRELRSLRGHTDLVNGVALRSDGKLAVSASYNKMLKVWAVDSGQELRTLQGHTGVVSGVALSGDGRLAVSASYDKTLKVWEVESGRELRTLRGHSDVVIGVALSGNGKLVSTSWDNTLKVWDMETGRELHTLHGHTNWVTAVAVSGEGKVAISASKDKTLKVWEVESGRELRTLRGHTDVINAVALTEDAKLAVSVSYDSTVRVWEVESGRELASFMCEGAALCCAFGNSTHVVAGDAGGRLYFLEFVLENRQFEEPQAEEEREDVKTEPERTMAEKKKHVFLSYCRENQAEVRRLRDDLIAAGEKVWWDGQLLAGQDWKLEIHKAIKNAYAIVICLSEQFEARIRSGAYPELRDAIDEYRQCAPGSIYLLPVRLSACEIPSLRIDGTTMLESLHYVDLFPTNKRSMRVQELIQAIQAAGQHP